MRFFVLILFVFANVKTSPCAEPVNYQNRASEVTDYIHDTFFDSSTGVYLKATDVQRPDYVWLQSVMFANLVAAARVEPEKYDPLLKRYFKALDIYWDSKVAIPGYEAAPTKGNGNDKYYDDNAWLVIAFMEAYETSRDAKYLERADETLKFVLSGWDEECGGGIWWHERHKDGTKNTCSNGPSAVGCIRMARFKQHGDKTALIDKATQIVNWTQAALQDTDGLYDDRKVVATGEIKRGKLTYNSALMLRASLGLYHQTGSEPFLSEAKRIGKAAQWFLDERTGVYRDALRYSHFMVEADLELYRTTQEPYLFDRAKRNVDVWFTNWSKQRPNDMMSNACLARVLWLMSETESAAGQRFWQEADRRSPAATSK